MEKVTTTKKSIPYDKDKETQLVEREFGPDCLTWECLECEEEFTFTCGTPEENKYRYCCYCGRKISEYVHFVYDLQEGE